MLDLTLMNNNDLYELRLLDGTELHLKRPTQAMVQFTLILQGLANNDKQLETIEALSSLFARILNRNIEGLTFEAEKLAEEYDFNVIGYVIEDYFGYWNEDTEEKVNFQQSQQK